MEKNALSGLINKQRRCILSPIMDTQNTQQQTILIAGLGLLGGSLGLALSQLPVRRLGWARKELTRSQALQKNIADEVFSSLEKALPQADIVVLALPVPVIIEMLPLCARVCQKGAIVTDIGSIKSRIITAAEQVFTSPEGPFFIGSHPMAGTEKSGIDAAFATLYDNADVFITPCTRAPEEAVLKLEGVWQALTCHTERISALRHDQLVAETSHAQHVVASALSLSILDHRDEAEKMARYRGCATGFKDTSRIASSSPLMWREIVEHNAPAVLEALDAFEKSLQEYRRLIESGDFDGFEKRFARGKELRDAWLKYKGMK